MAAGQEVCASALALLFGLASDLEGVEWIIPATGVLCSRGRTVRVWSRAPGSPRKNAGKQGPQGGAHGCSCFWREFRLAMSNAHPFSISARGLFSRRRDGGTARRPGCGTVSFSRSWLRRWCASGAVFHQWAGEVAHSGRISASARPRLQINPGYSVGQESLKKSLCWFDCLLPPGNADSYTLCRSRREHVHLFLQKKGGSKSGLPRHRWTMCCG